MVKHTAQFMHCYQENKLPVDLPKVFNNFFATPSKEKLLTGRNTQISICSSTNVGKQSIKFYGPKVWNQIAPDSDFRKCKNIITFTKKILPEISQNKIKLGL